VIIASIVSIVVFLLILGVLVLVHELGHFFVAKRVGIRVEEFGLGLPPKIKTLFRKDGTEYTLNLLPFGGFVRLTGEEPTPEDLTDERSFASKSRRSRAAVIMAGVVMNLIFATLIYTVLLSVQQFQFETPLLTDYHFPFGKETRSVIILDAQEGSPAKEAGIARGDTVLSLEGKSISEIEEFQEAVKEKQGQEVRLAVENKESGVKEVTLLARSDPPKDQGALGIVLGRFVKVSYETPFEKVFSGALHSVNILGYTTEILSQLIIVSFMERTVGPIGSSVSGPIGIFGLVNTILTIGNLQEKILGILELTALLSLSLGFINALPFPALDGGRLLFIGIETIIGRGRSMRVEAVVHKIGFALLLALLFLISIKDFLSL